MKVSVWENNRKTKEIKGKEQRELNQTGTEPRKERVNRRYLTHPPESS